MITLIFGEDNARSRQELINIKVAFTGEVITIDPSSPPADFINATQSNSLLQNSRLVIAENFWANAAKLSLDKLPNNLDVVFWEEKQLAKKDLDLAKILKVRNLEFKTDPQIFPFVESVRPGNGINATKLYRQCLKDNDPEQIFLMLVRQFRLMLNPGDLAPWQMAKINKQRQTYSSDRLARLYRQLLKIDYESKTSQLPGSLSGAIELLLLDL